MNSLFAILILSSLLLSAWHQWHWDFSSGEAPLQQLTTATITAAGDAVQLAFHLIGTMAFFLGLMKIAEQAGLLRLLARLIRPLMVRLFPEVPAHHPAMGAMIMNLSANALGLGNAATPFGIRAMQELDRLNPVPGTATNAMALFLAINTASITLMPSTVIALRAAAGSADPAAVLPTTLFASFGATAVAILVARLLQNWFPPYPQHPLTPQPPLPQRERGSYEVDSPGAKELENGNYAPWIGWLAMTVLLSLIPLSLIYARQVSPWTLPVVIAAIIMLGLVRRVAIYEAFIEGAKEGFDVAVRILPYLVAILSAVAMLRASGGLEAIVTALSPWKIPLGLPAEVLPMALLRPLSGSGAYGLLASLLREPLTGPDSYVGLLASTLQGSSETTFYVLAVYFGAVRVQRLRHTLAAALIADLAAVVLSILACQWHLSLP
ncbi:MAG: spore maturation protein [Magnetococcales bacterium]|nr:spore maturation protein [Magnetococcales bacterium]